jgi:hypothetical protein
MKYVTIAIILFFTHMLFFTSCSTHRRLKEEDFLWDYSFRIDYEDYISIVNDQIWINRRLLKKSYLLSSSTGLFIDSTLITVKNTGQIFSLPFYKLGRASAKPIPLPKGFAYEDVCIIQKYPPSMNRHVDPKRYLSFVHKETKIKYKLRIRQPLTNNFEDIIPMDSSLLLMKFFNGAKPGRSIAMLDLNSFIKKP